MHTYPSLVTFHFAVSGNDDDDVGDAFDDVTASVEESTVGDVGDASSLLELTRMLSVAIVRVKFLALRGTSSPLKGFVQPKTIHKIRI